MKAFKFFTNAVILVLVGGLAVLSLGIIAKLRIVLIPIFFGYCILIIIWLRNKLTKFLEYKE